MELAAEGIGERGDGVPVLLEGEKRENCLITYTPRLQVSCLWNCRPSHEVSVCTSQNDNQFDKAKETLSTFSIVGTYSIKYSGMGPTKRKE